MKIAILTCLCSITFALHAFGQTPTPAISSTTAASASDSANISPAAKERHPPHRADAERAASIAAAMVGIIFSTLFGAPVLIVVAIMFFSYLRSRSLHRTVREMVARGEPVPPALFAPSPAIRALSDLRRGVVLIMVGFGLMVFLGAVSDWDGGAWAIGVIPFLIGVGHLIVWKMEGPKESRKAPPLP